MELKNIVGVQANEHIADSCGNYRHCRLFFDKRLDEKER
jgi:hypothetical protein